MFWHIRTATRVFYFVSLDYAPGVEAVFAAEQAERAAAGGPGLLGQIVEMTHPILDIGQVADAQLDPHPRSQPAKPDARVCEAVELRSVTAWLGMRAARSALK